MSGYAFRATRVCVQCRREFTALISIAATAGVVWWRYEPRRCQECMK